MIIWISAIIHLLHSLHSTAAWDENSALILTQLVPQPKKFPHTVRISNKYRCKVYYTTESEATYAFCPNTENDFCNYSPSFVSGKYGKGQKPRELCQFPVLYEMIKVWRKDSHESCTHNQRTGYRFQYVYWLCKEKKNDTKTLATYNTCYDETNKQIILGRYTIAEPSLLRNEFLQDEQAHVFEYDSYPYQEDFSNHFQTVAYPLYRQNQDYVERMVLPPELLPYALQRKPLFHYMNLAPMHKDLIAGWKQMMDNLKPKVSSLSRNVNVTAGLLGTLHDNEGYTEYLGHIEGAWEIAIPSLWWVLIYNQSNTRGVVIMMHNELYYTNEGYPNLSYQDFPQCSHTVCSDANLLNALPSPEAYPHNFIYCCHPNVITSKFNLDEPNNLLSFPGSSR